MLLTSLANGLGTTLPASLVSKMQLVQAGSVAPTPGVPTAQTSADPMAEFGARAAVAIMARIKRLPEDRRLPFLRKALDSIDTNLWSTVDAAATRYVAAGQDAMTAYLAALSQNLSAVLLGRLAAVGAMQSGVQGLGQSLIQQKIAMLPATTVQLVDPNAPVPMMAEPSSSPKSQMFADADFRTWPN